METPHFLVMPWIRVADWNRCWGNSAIWPPNSDSPLCLGSHAESICEKLASPMSLASMYNTYINTYICIYIYTYIYVSLCLYDRYTDNILVILAPTLESIGTNSMSCKSESIVYSSTTLVWQVPLLKGYEQYVTHYMMLQNFVIRPHSKRFQNQFSSWYSR